MKILVVYLACVAMVSARPEAPLQGYNYNPPRPVGHPQVHSQSFGVSSSYQAAPAPAYHAPAYHPPAATGFGSAVSSSFGSASTTGFGSAISSSSGSAFASGGQSQFFAPQQTVVQKHIYVHVPPQEQEEVHSPQFVSQGVARKHYKIIFIKTPNVQPSAAQIALQQAQQEEKTIVYVLVKKPDEQQELSIPELAPVPPSKPEVYFIKYKANRGGAQLGSSSSGSGFASALGSTAVSSGGSSSVSGGGSLPHTQYGAPGGGHQGYP
ncbi:uncharacterized protein LOC129717790 [Wyeomyia smithii]|uniref:uncharacterized protein LOC129717790 n=1 Tax=Wyeomyia smithii TaxID=174621 RepID=UPI002467F7A2|nr:uncharacterized protein LOC129717790 [Wyeomyia smithii]